ncbi:MAG: HAD family hydrolase [Planctomycetota bacterium]|nr:MAG: HAD family hydrolase [Planctomycetota bacterium]
MIVALFDIDGTLLNTGGAGQAAMEAALAEAFGIRVRPHGIPTAGRTDRAITEDLFGHFGIPDCPGNRRLFVDTYVRHLQRTLAECRGAVLPGVRDLLETLSGDGRIVIGLLTGNYSRGAWAKLRHFRLDAYFAFGAFGDEHRHRDDVAREARRELARRLDPDRSVRTVWVIGDTPADVTCGRAIGARTMAVATGVFPADVIRAAGPDVLLDDLSDHARVVRTLLDGHPSHAPRDGCC